MWRRTALVAAAYTILVIASHLRTRQDTDRGLGATYDDTQDRRTVERCLVRRLERSGNNVIVAPLAATGKHGSSEEVAVMWEQAPSSSTYLGAAEAAARWIRSAAMETERGLIWLDEPDHPEKAGSIAGQASVYTGNAGIMLFFLQLAQATGDASYLEDATRGADYLLKVWPEIPNPASPRPRDQAGLDFYRGLAGTSLTLFETWRATGEEAYRDAALAISQRIAAEAKPAGQGVAWMGAPCLIGDGSLVLQQLWAAETFAEPSFVSVATRAGDRILELAERDPRGGLRWKGLPDEWFGLPAGVYTPNFELGTAGVAFLLARLYTATREQRFLDGAREGARHVQALAAVRDDAALLLYREPDLTDLYYLGYCHGPAGTARLFYELHAVTSEPSYLEWMERFARGIVASGVPERQTPGLWNVVCQCCGTAGIADFFLGLWAATRRPEHLAFARRVLDQTLSRATDLDGKGLRWYQAWTRVQPWAVAAETGYMIGAAGVGAALLHLHLALEGRYATIAFPDNPFPSAVPA